LATTYNVRANFHLSGNKYGTYETSYGPQILIIDKAGATPGNNWEQRLSNINWGEPDNLKAFVRIR
jgi:hypothetical protein